MTPEENALLTQTGRDTPMGALLRRCWLPALLSQDLPNPDGPPVRVPLLGERLVAFRDTFGAVGLLEEGCPHRLDGVGEAAFEPQPRAGRGGLDDAVGDGHDPPSR